MSAPVGRVTAARPEGTSREAAEAWLRDEVRRFGVALAEEVATAARYRDALTRIEAGPRAGLYHPEEMQDVAREALSAAPSLLALPHRGTTP
jgi:hypothetical protein